jgi:class 3 adenylate cyclase
MDVASFLHGLGLKQYEQAFRDNAIDAEVLSDLTDGDLAALGVLLGHRKKILKAIAALHPAATGEAVAPPAEATALPPSTVARAPDAERRQLTVMFVDLVGSTELAARLDLEDMGPRDPRLSGLLRRCGRALGRPCRQVHGRRCARLFRLAAGA